MWLEEPGGLAEGFRIPLREHSEGNAQGCAACGSGCVGWGKDGCGCSGGLRSADISAPENGSWLSSWIKMPMKASAMAALALDSPLSAEAAPDTNHAALTNRTHFAISSGRLGAAIPCRRG